MSQYTEEQIQGFKEVLIGKNVSDFYYEPEGDYYVIEFENGFETSFRFMADLV